MVGFRGTNQPRIFASRSPQICFLHFFERLSARESENTPQTTHKISKSKSFFSQKLMKVPDLFYRVFGCFSAKNSPQKIAKKYAALILL
jgi:hypothetical protein